MLYSFVTNYQQHQYKFLDRNFIDNKNVLKKTCVAHKNYEYDVNSG